jgi:hypothetical protein
LKTLSIDADSTYQVELDKVLKQSFGTADFYSRALKNLGWEAIDIIANEERLQRLWTHEQNGAGNVLLAQIADFKPDVVFFQDLSVCNADTLALLKEKYVLAGQCSCPMPSAKLVCQFDVLFTSFPHYVEQFEALGVRAVYNPLAFDPIVVMGRTIQHAGREIDVAFVGGVGNPSHWKYGMEVLETVAKEIPTSFFWGYGYETLPSNSAIRQRYRGQAWGLRMYEILQQSKIVINRHGEVARGMANNMKLFETTGCGALLLTEDAPNLPEFFAYNECAVYKSPKHAVEQIRCLLEDFELRKEISMRGQERTMREHTYSKRMETVSRVLLEEIS